MESSLYNSIIELRADGNFRITNVEHLLRVKHNHVSVEDK